MAELDAIYNAYNEITDAGENAPQHVEAYSQIIAGAQGTEGTKRLAAQYGLIRIGVKEENGLIFIPTFFKHFPDLHSRAIDGVFDLCEDLLPVVRQAAIKSLPSLCRDGPQHTIKIADVLCQLLQLDDEDLVIVQGALQTLLVQSPRGIKGVELRDKTMDFITNQVVTAFRTGLVTDPEIELFFVDEMRKAMGSVSDSELESFAKIIMQTTLYKTGALENLTGLSHIYVAHITSEVPWNIRNPDSIKRVLVAGKLSMPLFQRNVSADVLLEFFATHILPRNEFEQLTDKQRAHVLRLYTDSITTGHPSPAALKRAGGLLGDLLVMIVPAEQDSTTPVEFAQVECLVLALDLLTQDPDLLDRDDLVARFRNLYNLTQIQLSSIKQAIKTASSKVPQDAEQITTIKTLTRTQTIHHNIHTIEFLKPKKLWTKHALHPSWKPVPEPNHPVVPKTAETSKLATASPLSVAKPGANLSTRLSAKPAAQPDTKPGLKPTPQRQQPSPLQQRQQQQQGALNKRKAEPESNTKQKKPKITRPQGPGVGSLSAGNSSPNSQGPKGAKHSQSQQQVQGQTQAQGQSPAQVQAQQKQKQQPQRQQPIQKHQLTKQPPQTLKQRGQSSPKGSPKVSSKSSPRVVHGSQQQGKKSPYGFNNGASGAGGSGSRGLTSPSFERERRRRDTNKKINFLQPR
ncbi:Apoptosis inhibitor 5 [Linnemannia hyalina]|uniref:Apoptosis inhibitor 5 n=1 Tax=Linnemannia hyalina TaxID=64524 RepID=A0A9P7XVF1_9FUNG|nr:Apoptosis inhibitor 5 [Linnemannia hyalina]